MPVARFLEFAVPQAVQAGASKDTEDLVEKTVQVLGTFVATLAIQGTVDGSTWGDIQTDITAPGLVQIPGTFRAMRINVTAYVSGTPRALLGARDSRTR